MAGYTKLFSSILDSTVWSQPTHVRIVWVTMLAMVGHDGVVEASVPGLAKRAGVSVADAEDALACFMAPDPYSRTKDNDGRRIAEVDGGWELLNHLKYKHKASESERRERAAARAKTYRDRHAPSHADRDASRPATESNASNDIRSDQIRSKGEEKRAPAGAGTLFALRSENSEETERESAESESAASVADAAVAPPRTQPAAVDRLPEFSARQMSTVFVREYEAVQRSTPSMGGKHVDGLHAMVIRTAELQGVSPELLFLDTVRAWLSNQLSDRERQSPYACFTQAWGALTAKAAPKSTNSLNQRPGWMP